MRRTAEQQREYDKYLCSDAWRKKRDLALERDNHRCRLCNNSKGLQVHHRTYESTWENGLGNEPIEDLTTLCRRCHDKFHGPAQRRSTKRAKKGRKKKAKEKKAEALRRREKARAKPRDRSPKPATRADIEALAKQMNAHLRVKDQRREGDTPRADALPS